MARIEEIQAKGAREGQHRGPDDRLWTEPKAAFGLRSRTPEEDRDGGGPAPTRRAIPTPPTPPTPHDEAWRFSTSCALPRTRVNRNLGQTSQCPLTTVIAGRIRESDNRMPMTPSPRVAPGGGGPARGRTGPRGESPARLPWLA